MHSFALNTEQFQGKRSDETDREEDLTMELKYLTMELK